MPRQKTLMPFDEPILKLLYDHQEKKWSVREVMDELDLHTENERVHVDNSLKKMVQIGDAIRFKNRFSKRVHYQASRPILMSLYRVLKRLTQNELSITQAQFDILRLFAPDHPILDYGLDETIELSEDRVKEEWDMMSDDERDEATKELGGVPLPFMK